MEKNSGITKSQIKEFGDIIKINSSLLDSFINFELSVSGSELMERMNLKPSQELGDLIKKLETDNFKKSLK